MTSRTDTNGSLNDRMAKMRAAKAAKFAKTAQPPPETAKIGEMFKVTLPKQYEQPPVMKGILDVQIGTDDDMQNVTLIVKGPAPKMRALVRFAIEQSVPFLNNEGS